jgi:Ala-tRNA(Pro) deacylase
MPTSQTLASYLNRRGEAYDEVIHEPTMSSMRTAQACHVSADNLAKAVVLKGGGGYLLAVLPASHHLRASDNLRFASEDEIAKLFPDCERGAIPPVGAAYGLTTIMDDAIAEKPDVYFVGGDHATLVHMSGDAFCRVMADARHGRISAHD